MPFAFVFPGQGSQAVGMLAELAARFPQVQQTFAQASEALGYDLWEVVSSGPAERLDQTEITQPAMLAAGVAVWRVWRAEGGAEPALMAGHSLGEYTALVCAGVLRFEGAVALVAERGRLMQAAVPAGVGGMAAVLGLGETQVRAVCEQGAEDQVLEPMNFNSPEQIVIAGHKTAVERGMELARAAGAKRVVPLRVSVPSHCRLMAPAAEQLSARLQQVSLEPPRIPVLHNCDVAAHHEPEAIRTALTQQLCQPVRWTHTIQAMAAQGVDTLIECGPGKVLTGLTRRIDRALRGVAVYDPESLQAAQACLVGD